MQSDYFTPETSYCMSRTDLHQLSQEPQASVSAWRRFLIVILCDIYVRALQVLDVNFQQLAQIKVIDKGLLLLTRGKATPIYASHLLLGSSILQLLLNADGSVP
jgi:hypothetical protein